MYVMNVPENMDVLKYGIDLLEVRAMTWVSTKFRLKRKALLDTFFIIRTFSIKHHERRAILETLLDPDVPAGIFG